MVTRRLFETIKNYHRLLFIACYHCTIFTNIMNLRKGKLIALAQKIFYQHVFKVSIKSTSSFKTSIKPFVFSHSPYYIQTTEIRF